MSDDELEGAGDRRVDEVPDPEDQARRDADDARDDDVDHAVSVGAHRGWQRAMRRVRLRRASAARVAGGPAGAEDRPR